MRLEAWVTSAVEEASVRNALVLAASLRRVRTSKKLIVLTTSAVTESSRSQLKMAFDLVILFEGSVNGLSLEDHAKIEGFSLLAFDKCVYLSPNTMVLKNCDDILETDATFAACEDDNGLNSSVYLFTPSLESSISLGKIGHNSKGDFAQCLKLWIEKHSIKWGKLDEQYNTVLHLKSESFQSLSYKASNVNFSDDHPANDGANGGAPQLWWGPVEKFAVGLCGKLLEQMGSEEQNLYLNPAIQPEVFKTEPIAIVGMSFRLPGGNNENEFWDLLINSREAIQHHPENRWSRDFPKYLSSKNRKVEAGFLNIPIDEFDAKFFGINGADAEFLDPQQRLLHEVAWEALEDAMIDPSSIRGTQTGIFAGSWLQDYKELVAKSVDLDFFRVYVGNSLATQTARLSHFFETTGPSIATESGCSSAIVAVDMACKSLRNHNCSMAMACGVNLLLHPFEYETLPVVFSPDGRCKTFDENANGFGRAEGCAVLILKRLSDAAREGDIIWGLIRGSGVSQEGLSKSLGTPTVHGESLAMELALKEACVDPNDVSYIEAHGTGTAVGDPLEVAAIAKSYSKNGRVEPLVIGSVKTNIGHTESASGITGIIKVLLSMKNERIPAHLNLEKLNPAINLDAIPAVIPLESMPWPKREDKPRLAGVSSFGITGTDGHVVLQEAPSTEATYTELPERPLHIMKISAKCPESFQELLKIYENILATNENTPKGFADMAYSANTGRATFNHRAVIIASDFNQAFKIIKEKSFKQAEVQSGGRQLCFLFTGQGSQYPNMAANLYDTSPVFRDHFDKCDRLMTQRYAINMREVLWGKSSDGTELSRTLYSQTSIFCIEYCLLKLWESWGVKPEYVMGHSLGEFAAAVAAGALGFEDALMLVAERSRLINSLPQGKMLVIKADKKVVDQNIQKFKQANPNFWVDYAALNSPDQTVVAGDAEMIEEFAKFCGDNSLKTIVLAATHAFHSRHMEPMLAKYRKIAETVKPLTNVKDAPLYISGMEGKLVDLESTNADYWVRHTREPVRFMDACKVAQSEGCSLFLEVGPHPVLSALTMMNFEGQSITCLPSIRRKEDEWATMLDSLSKLYLSDWKGEVDWKGFDRYYERSRVSLPFYPFNRKPIWKEYEPTHLSVHPLLGKVVPTVGEETIFENRISMKNTPFTQDHVIGTTVVFPGAGFLEMCLAGGHLTVQPPPVTGDLQLPQRPIVIKSLRIATPLGLYDKGICRLQTGVKLDADNKDEITYSVGVHRFVPSTTSTMGEWVSHATAKFLPVPADLTSKRSIPFEVNIEELKNSSETFDSSGFYDQLPEVGLRFGPQFRSLEMGWKTEHGILLAVKVPKTSDDEAYLIHPVVADAMIQAVMLWTIKDKPKTRLQVPVQIGEFTWLRITSSSSRFIYCSTNGEGNTDCILLDGEGLLLARMSGVDFIETSVKLIDGMLQRQGISMPKLWREVWKSAPGALQYSCDFRTVGDIQLCQYTEEQRKMLTDLNELDEYEASFLQNLNNLCRLFFLNAMYDLGWKPEQAVPFTVEELWKLLPEQKEHFRRYIRFFLKSLAEAGMITAEDGTEDKYHFSKSPPTQDEIDLGLQRVVGPKDYSRVEYELVVRTGRNLANVWRGEADPLQLLFPEDLNVSSVGDFYASLESWVFTVFELVTQKFVYAVTEEAHAHFRKVNKPGTPSPILHVLEVGAGTGSLTKEALKSFEGQDKPFDYHFTDISASFFTAAETKFKDYANLMTFKKFDMEKDPLAQGFCPGYFDIIMACEVIHVAKDIRKTLRNLQCLLKPGGILLILETTMPDLRFSQIFGLLDGYWQFEDLDFRPYHITLTPDKWEQALRELNYDKVICTPAYNNSQSVISARLSPLEGEVPFVHIHEPQYSWVIFYHQPSAQLAELLKKKLMGVNRKVHLVKRPETCTEMEIKDLMKSEFRIAMEGVENVEGVLYLWGMSDDSITDRDQCQVSLPLVSLVQEVLEFKVPPKVFMVTQGSANVDGFELTNPSASTLSGIIKTLANENTGMQVSCLDMSPDDPAINQVDEIFYNLWVSDKGNRNFAFRDDNRWSSKLVASNVSNHEPLPLPSGCDRFQLILPKTRVISDLEFGALENCPLKENEIEVQVKAMALNFRDVFAVLKPIVQFESINSVGLDFAGVVTKVGSKVTTRKVGDRVIGVNNEKDLSLPSHVKISEQVVVPLPPHITFAEGSTLPAVLGTVVYCLINVTKLKKGETILIHTASGGVGLCAIQLAQRVGANIIATAGSKRKQNYLRNLGIQHIFHSRTTEFGKQILELTNGNGVDVVLNSLTGEGFKEASLSALSMNGRFIEMSKLNVWKEEEVKGMRPDVFYQVVDLSPLSEAEVKLLFDEMKGFIDTGYFTPIPYERFDSVNIRGALNYLQKAKHIGKIVCVMPEVKIENSKIIATTPLFNEFSTYLVTGGLGGIGFEVVKWMLRSGAKHVAIASRSPPKPEVEKKIESWNKSGNHVEAFAMDIGDYSQCQKLFQDIKSPDRDFPQLRGVMHVAGVLADSILENQTWDKFKRTYNSKVNGTWNLHDLTKDQLLEHFVVFSSMAALIGSPGQSNHSASNSFEDHLVAYRRSIGLPASSVNWGNWGEVGVATEMDFPGFRPISTSQGILALETILKTQSPQLSVMNVESFAPAVKIYPNLKYYVDDKTLFGDIKVAAIINSDEFWKQVDSTEDRQEKLQIFKTFLKSTLRNLLKMDQDEVIDDLAEFQALGIDSLMMLEMKNGIQNILGSRMTITASQLKDCSNTEALASRLVDALLGEVDNSKTVLPTIEELRQLVREDSILPDNVKPLEGMEVCDVSKIETVLLTGSSGTLGPYLLRELSHRSSVKKIYCLVRKIGNVTPSERLTNRLQGIGLVGQVDMSKVECIAGDISDDKFGLPDEEYNRLAGEVDAIINSAVRADHTSKYCKAPDRGRNDVRSVNVKGTIRILEFATHSKLKHVYHASTLLTVTTTDDGGCISEEWQDVGAFDELEFNAGYVLSKHISEQLMKQASERGVPCKTFRHPYIGGDSKTGRCDYLTNHFVLRWLAYMKLGCMPDITSPLVSMAVDHCAEVSLEVFFNSRALPGVYNILHKNGGMDQTIIGIAEEIGIVIEPVSFSEFVGKLKLESDDSPLAPFKKMYEDEEDAVVQNFEGGSSIQVLQKYVEDSSSIFKSRKLPLLIQNYDGMESTEEVMRRDIRYLKESGVFDKFGIK